MAMGYWTKFALVAGGVLGVGYIAKKAQASGAVHQKVSDAKLVPGQTIKVNLPAGSYTIDPSLIQPPADLPNGIVSAKFLVGELNSAGQVSRIHAMYTPPSGVNVNVAFDPKQVISA